MPSSDASGSAGSQPAHAVAPVRHRRQDRDKQDDAKALGKARQHRECGDLFQTRSVTGKPPQSRHRQD